MFLRKFWWEVEIKEHFLIVASMNFLETFSNIFENAVKILTGWKLDKTFF